MFKSNLFQQLPKAAWNAIKKGPSEKCILLFVKGLQIQVCE